MVRKQIFVGAFALLCLFISSCGDSEDSSIALVFKATYDNAPLVIGESLTYGDTEILITDSDFLISNITLVSETEEVLLEEVGFIDFTNNNLDEASASAGISLNYDLPVGSYNMLRFSIGVPSDINELKPENFESDSPLSNSGYYWTAWDSFIFSRMQGFIDTVEPGPNDLGWIFHTGRDDFYRTIEIPININLDSDETNTIVINYDHFELFKEDDGSLFDIESSPLNHTPSSEGPIATVVDNYANAFEVE